MSATLHIHLLGEFRLVSDATVPAARFSPRLQALLAYLVLHRGLLHPRQQLAFLLWPDSSEAQARTNLRKQVFQLRHNVPALDLYLSDDGSTLSWRSDAPYTLDVADFEQAAKTDLEHALSLYSGPLLPNCYDDWILPQRERLHQLYLDTAEQLIQQLEESGAYRAAINHAQRLLRDDPLHEVTYRRLMRLYDLTGDRTGALRVYRTCETVLQRELGVEPSAATREVYEHLMSHESAPRATPSTARREEVRTHNLPLALTSFVGRESELSEVEQLLSQTRLLTLTGAGGSGKTRLALQVAQQLLHKNQFPDGVWWVELAALSNAVRVPQELASVLGLKERSDQSLAQTIAEHLCDGQVLLLLDNCEHLIAACAQLSTELLQGCPNLHILTTSREALGVAGETTWLVPGLSCPAQQPSDKIEDLMESESVRLFVDRAAAALPTFRLTKRNAHAVAQVCCELDGIPLAIELAATRVKMLSMEQLAGRLTDSLQLLSSGNRTAPQRHQTLQAAIDWSHGLLSEPERVLWRRLSVFAGGFTLAAAEAVCAADGIAASDILVLLSYLIDKSLVLVAERESTSEARYRLLETVRQYGRLRLDESGETASIQRRHAQFFLELAETAEPHFTRSDQGLWLSRLETEHDNLRAALNWSLNDTQSGETGLRIAGALWHFWLVRGYLSEGRQWLEQTLAGAAHAHSAARAKALLSSGSLARTQGDYARARVLFEQALEIYRELGDNRGMATALNSLGIVAKSQGDLNRAMAFYEESLKLRQEFGDRRDLATTLNNLGVLVRRQGDYARAQQLLEQSLALCRELEDKRGQAMASLNLGNVMRHLDDTTRARALLEASMKLYKEVGDRGGQAIASNSLGSLARNQHDLEQALALHEQSLALYQDMADQRGIAGSINAQGWVRLMQQDADRAQSCFAESIALNRKQDDRYGMIDNLHGLAIVAALRQQWNAAARLFGAVEALFESVGAVVPLDDRVVVDQHMLETRRQLGETGFGDALTLGRALTLEQAIAEALRESTSSPLP